MGRWTAVSHLLTQGNLLYECSRTPTSKAEQHSYEQAAQYYWDLAALVAPDEPDELAEQHRLFGEQLSELLCGEDFAEAFIEMISLMKKLRSIDDGLTEKEYRKLQHLQNDFDEWLN